MPNLEQNLILNKCPHCSVNNPNLIKSGECNTKAHDGNNLRYWHFYRCAQCGGIVTASARQPKQPIVDLFPEPKIVQKEIPSPAKAYLEQALETIYAPSGSIMLSASSVDAMLKNKGYSEKSLYTRINQAATDHLITKGMAEWAHRVRLDANGQRHADQNTELPTTEDAQQTLDFVNALGQFLFVLPAKVQRGLNETEDSEEEGN